MTPLRKKMIRAMELRNFSHNTQRGYLSIIPPPISILKALTTKSQNHNLAHIHCGATDKTLIRCSRMKLDSISIVSLGMG
jgi:hypothetical protein